MAKEASSPKETPKKKLFFTAFFDFYCPYSRTVFPENTPVEVPEITGLLQSQVDAGLAKVTEE